MQEPVGLIVGASRQHHEIEGGLRVGAEAAFERRVEARNGLGDEVSEGFILGRHTVNASLTTTLTSTKH